MRHPHPLSSPCVSFTPDATPLPVLHAPLMQELHRHRFTLSTPPSTAQRSTPRGRPQSHQAPHPRNSTPLRVCLHTKEDEVGWIGFSILEESDEPAYSWNHPFWVEPNPLGPQTKHPGKWVQPNPAPLNSNQTHAYSFHQVHTTHENTLHFSRIQL